MFHYQHYLYKQVLSCLSQGDYYPTKSDHPRLGEFDGVVEKDGKEYEVLDLSIGYWKIKETDCVDMNDLNCILDIDSNKGDSDYEGSFVDDESMTSLESEEESKFDYEHVVIPEVPECWDDKEYVLSSDFEDSESCCSESESESDSEYGGSNSSDSSDEEEEVEVKVEEEEGEELSEYQYPSVFESEEEFLCRERELIVELAEEKERMRENFVKQNLY